MFKLIFLYFLHSVFRFTSVLFKKFAKSLFFTFSAIIQYVEGFSTTCARKLESIFGAIQATKKAEETRKAAKRSTDSLASWDSAQYWQYRKLESQASLTINEVDNEIEKENTGSEAQTYRKRKRELEEETESACRKITRYEARARIIEAAKTTNPASIRASFLELKRQRGDGGVPLLHTKGDVCAISEYYFSLSARVENLNLIILNKPSRHSVRSEEMISKISLH